MLYFSSAHAAKKSLTMNFAHCILIAGVMKMNTLGEPDGQALQSTKLLAELYDIAKELSEDEQLFLLDTVKALKLRLGKRL